MRYLLPGLLKVTTTLVIAINSVRQSNMESRPICQQIASGQPAGDIHSVRKIEIEGELRIFFTNGFNKTTNGNEGMKMAIVTTIAPSGPLI
jgi:hypothetical protein